MHVLLFQWFCIPDSKRPDACYINEGCWHCVSQEITSHCRIWHCKLSSFELHFSCMCMLVNGSIIETGCFVLHGSHLPFIVSNCDGLGLRTPSDYSCLSVSLSLHAPTVFLSVLIQGSHSPGKYLENSWNVTFGLEFLAYIISWFTLVFTS